MTAVMPETDPGYVWRFATVPEPTYCASRYLGHATTPYPIVCTLDAAHDHDSVDSRHGNGAFRRTDAEAAASLAEYRAPAKTRRPLCTDCESRPQTARGRCQYCAATELAADNYEPESEDA